MPKKAGKKKQNGRKPGQDISTREMSLPSGNDTSVKSKLLQNSDLAKNVEEDDRTWDEKDEDELELFLNIESSGDNEGQRKKKDGQKDDMEGVSYPIDIWFLISESIQPEDVGRFAAICQTTYYVVSTARFWFALYRRHYDWKAYVPESLTYHRMDNVKGLKSAVIRSLYYTHPPFASRLAKEKPLSGHPEQLIGAECVSQWHKSIGSYHKYYFMFNTKIDKHCHRKFHVHSLPDLSIDSLVHINQDEGCYILEVVSTAVSHIPVVMGSYLHQGHLGLSTGFCSHRLQVTLGPSYLVPKNNSRKHRPSRLVTNEMFQITVEPARDVRIYPWWHPKYERCLLSTEAACEYF